MKLQKPIHFFFWGGGGEGGKGEFGTSSNLIQRFNNVSRGAGKVNPSIVTEEARGSDDNYREPENQLKIESNLTSNNISQSVTSDLL